MQVLFLSCDYCLTTSYLECTSLSFLKPRVSFLHPVYEAFCSFLSIELSDSAILPTSPFLSGFVNCSWGPESFFPFYFSSPVLRHQVEALLPSFLLFNQHDGVLFPSHKAPWAWVTANFLLLPWNYTIGTLLFIGAPVPLPLSGVSGWAPHFKCQQKCCSIFQITGKFTAMYSSEEIVVIWTIT